MNGKSWIPKLLFASSCLLGTACGAHVKVKGGTTNTVETNSVAEVVFKVDISGCMDLPAEDRIECIKAITDAVKEFQDIAKVLYCTNLVKDDSRKQGPHSPITCGDLSALVSDEGSGS
jgi:hypothetical protein